MKQKYSLLVIVSHVSRSLDMTIFTWNIELVLKSLLPLGLSVSWIAISERPSSGNQIMSFKGPWSSPVNHEPAGGIQQSRNQTP